MPIQGLTEKCQLPRLGKIHLGIKKTKTVNGKPVEYPSAVDFFVCPPEVQSVFGETPKELRILIPLEDEERWASQYYRCYTQTRGLVCKGDGLICMRMVDTETGALADSKSKAVVMKEMECKGRDCPDYNVQCREVMNLQFLLPEVPGLGIWQIDTSSINSIKNINSAADFIRRIYGRIAMIPLTLTLEPHDIQEPGTGKKRTVHVLNLRTNQTLLELMETASARRLTAGEQEPEMPTPDDEMPELIMPQNQEPEVTAQALAEVPGTSPEAKTAEGAEPKIDMGWLEESLKELSWNPTKWLLDNFKVKGKSITELVDKLTQEQQEAFVKQVQTRLDIHRAQQK